MLSGRQLQTRDDEYNDFSLISMIILRSLQYWPLLLVFSRLFFEL
jgi:hypothetical protein